MNSEDHKKFCYRCGVEKPLEDFILRLDDRHYNMCRVCVSEILLDAKHFRKQRLNHTSTHRTCYLCKRFLPSEKFTRRTNGTYFSACKDCNRHVFAQRRRARMQGSTGTYTVVEWKKLVAKYDRCPMCKRRWAEIPPLPSGASVITADHIVPLSKGGGNNIENIQPLCYSAIVKKETKYYK